MLNRKCNIISSYYKIFKRSRYYVSKLHNVEDAALFMNQLSAEERSLIKEYVGIMANLKNHDDSPPSFTQLRNVMIYNGIPFMGFGIVDNLILILAGESIDYTLGMMFGLSTMAAAAMGNIVADVAGIGLAHYIEQAAASFGLPTPNLTMKQQNMQSSKWCTNLGRSLGITFGCLIGMFPLLFIPSEKQTSQAETPSLTIKENFLTEDPSTSESITTKPAQVEINLVPLPIASHN